jgi:hypothetical protein
MEGVSEHQNCFLIDLLNQRVFCRSCRQMCMKLTLPRFTLFWCADRDCNNTGEVRLTCEGTWNVYNAVEAWFENQCSAFASKLLFTLVTGRKNSEKSC